MIAFKDFAPQQTAPGSLLSLPVYEMFDSAVEAANAWVVQESVRVLNVETVVLPNLWHPGKKGTGDPLLRVNSDLPVDWYQLVRVWYQPE
ncbi:MAG: hypothetical protein ACRYFS_20390 [Janthinobacterium lividum]